MLRLQHALREMLVCAVLITPALFYLDKVWNAESLVLAFIVAVMLSPIPWAIYRIGRFIFRRPVG